MKRTILIALIVSILFCAYAKEAVDDYCYEKLTISEQVAYEAFLDCISCIIPQWNSGSFSQDTLQKAYECLLMDHPELYWSETFTYVTSFINNEISGHHVEFEYTMDRPKIESSNAQIKDTLNRIAGTLDNLNPDYENVKKVYEWFIRNCTYDDRNMDQTMYSIMVNQSGVCASFSKAFEFVVQCLGIPCTVVNGRLRQSSGFLGTTVGHQWNLVKLDGKWYHVDVTSGLSVSQDKVGYDFLCVPTEEILKTHVIDNIVPIPDCYDDSLMYYRHYGMEVSSYSYDNVLLAFRNSIKAGLSHPTVKFATYRSFTDAKEDLIDNLKLFDVVKALYGTTLETLDYRIDETNQVLEIII